MDIKTLEALGVSAADHRGPVQIGSFTTRQQYA